MNEWKAMVLPSEVQNRIDEELDEGVATFGVPTMWGRDVAREIFLREVIMPAVRVRAEAIWSTGTCPSDVGIGALLSD